MLRVALALALAPAFPFAAHAAPNVVASARSGDWSDAATWAGGKVPAAGDKVLVATGHTVAYDAKSDAVIRSVHVSGTLAFAVDKDTLLNVGLIKIQAGDSTDEAGFDCEAHVAPPKPGVARPALLVGTPDAPVTKRAVIRLHYIDGMDKESCPAIVCCGGRMDFHGAPLDRTWVKLGATAKAGDTALTLAEPVSGWNPGDRVIVTTSDLKEYKQGGTDEGTLAALDGTKLVLSGGLKFAHAGGEYSAEVANLSRTVVVESADPTAGADARAGGTRGAASATEWVRGHTMYHRHSAGSISYAEFRHLGKRDTLGRYALHFHLCGDTMRGSSVVGASIWDSHNRWLTVHGTQYLVVRDCVGYRSVGHGFFLEDGTEVYNVFDRNLAVQALEGKPLPKQILPFDKNDGAGFWWANSHNTFTRNVATGCGQYGFRFDAQPKAGVQAGNETFGEPKKPFDLALGVRQPDGTATPTDVRTLPFVRFEGNESHGHGKWGLNLGQHSGGKVGPPASSPFHIRDMKIWSVVGGFGVEVPNVRIDGMVVHNATYGVRESQYVAQDYRGVVIKTRAGVSVGTLDQYLAAKSSNGNNRVRQPGWPAGNGDGGAKMQPPETEVAKLTPVDALPPQTVITRVSVKGGKLLVRGTCSDDGDVKGVSVNGVAAKATRANFAEWEVELPTAAKLTAGATDAAGNVEQTPHAVAVGR